VVLDARMSCDTSRPSPSYLYSTISRTEEICLSPKQMHEEEGCVGGHALLAVHCVNAPDCTKVPYPRISPPPQLQVPCLECISLNAGGDGLCPFVLGMSFFQGLLALAGTPGKHMAQGGPYPTALHCSPTSCPRPVPRTYISIGTVFPVWLERRLPGLTGRGISKSLLLSSFSQGNSGS
jgi:hypothetical protein